MSDAIQLRPQLADAEQRLRSVNIRRVPAHVWRQARMNALLSQMPFREYCIHLLATGTAVAGEASGPAQT